MTFMTQLFVCMFLLYVLYVLRAYSKYNSFHITTVFSNYISTSSVGIVILF